MAIPEDAPPNTRLGEVPRGLRALVRASEVGIVLLASGIGVLAGVCVVALGWITQALHVLVFDIGIDQRLSTVGDLDGRLTVLGPTLGGLVFGVVSWLVFRGREQPIDPIEANALHGGRMSVRDSLIVALQTSSSSGVGASVGLEAGYTQLASGLASAIGTLFHLRRADLRLLVGCAAGAAIGAAFNAPLAGAFYGFELIIGTYSIAAFAPVMAATFTATVTRRLLSGPDMLTPLPAPADVAVTNLPALMLLGIACGLAGIGVMRLATLLEGLFRRSAMPVWLRPAVGGLVVGLLALWSPVVLSAGHGAMHDYAATDSTLPYLATLLVAKALASAVSIGSGFRGGLFFASLLLGVIFGNVFAMTAAMLVPDFSADPSLFALVGMSAFAVSVIGGPMTMTLLALESTGDLAITLAVLGAAGAASLVTRELFGFSFATWRFHLRGENIRSAHDVGWLRDLTVGTMMRLEVPTLDADALLQDARRRYPPGSTGYIVAVESDGSYAGMIPPASLYEPSDAAVPQAASPQPPTIRALIGNADRALLAGMNVREALGAFDDSESEALAVIADRQSRRVVGLLSEAHAIRRYSEEVSRRNRELTGD